MLSHKPHPGTASTLQAFGANPSLHATYGCSEVPLRGHEGIDLALPAGTAIVAAQQGAVLSTGRDARFGLYVLLGHPWGQSLYANLVGIAPGIGAGVSVSGGQMLGRIGAPSGNVPAHLHFGMRISPFSVADGFCGYSDPQPYLDRLTVGRGAIIGPHILGGVHQHLPVLRTWQPRLITVVDPNPDEMSLLREACPDAVIIGRVYAPDNEVSDRIKANPVMAAQWAHDLVAARKSAVVNYWQVANEVLTGRDDIARLAEFEIARMGLAMSAGIHCAIFAFSVGTPDLPENDRMGIWRMLYPALQRAEDEGHVVALHQYAAPDMKQPTLDWHIHRLEHQVLRRLPFKKLQFAVTEFGIDGLLLEPSPKGWQGFTGAQEYTSQLLRAGRYLERFSGRVLGYSVFSLGVTGGWESYDIRGEVGTMLAQQSQRGTWRQVNTDSGGLESHEGDAPTTPGGAPSTPPPPDPGQPANPPPPPAITRRISDSATAYNMRVKSISERPDAPTGAVSYLIKDVFTTRNGSWEPTSEPGSIPQWARDSYLSSSFLEAGADHHLFAAVIGLDGKMIPAQEIIFWSDGFAQLGNPAYDGYIRERTKDGSRWANMVLFSSSSFVPERGESGPFCWAPPGRSEVMTGGGMPSNHHISTFVVWQAVEGSAQPPAPPPQPPAPPQPPTPPAPPPTQPEITVPRRTGSWIDSLNAEIKGVSERPDAPGGDIVYVVKDIFTTRDGSWEPSNQMGSVDIWARDGYLKPWGAPDYFDDAGADHHLFAHVLGLNGKPIPEAEIVYWSDGFAQLANPAYTGYVSRLTKSHSGWANIPMAGSNYFPENGQQGPWCWAPKGASEVVVGGGMPANHHVSFFVVWQAVERTAPLPPNPDFSIFVPWVHGQSTAPNNLPLPPEMEQPSGEGLEVGEQLRGEIWRRLGIGASAQSALAHYARRAGLGMPVTQEFTAAGCLVQGFAGGIVYAPLAAPSEIRHVSW